MSELIEFSEEQSMLLDTAMDFCLKQSPLAKVRTQLDVEEGFDKDQWRSMVDLGWLAITVPETYGGLGLGISDVVPISESMGRALMGSPFLATTLASQALINGGSEDQKAEWLPKIASGSMATLALFEEQGDWDLKHLTASGTTKGGDILLSGKKTFVMDARVAELMVTSALIDGDARLLCIDTKSIPADQIVREVVIDDTRRCYEVRLDGVSVPETSILPVDCFKVVENAALLLISAEMSGGIAATLNEIIEYLNTRKQFDRYIGSYQALKHPTVDILLGLEEAKSLLYHAATIFEAGSEVEVETAARMVKASASKHFAFAGDRAVQFHGGFGFTFDCNAQLFLRRAMWCQYSFGDEKHQRQKLAPLLLD
jgi:acyl-CoA dehydrogenase